MPIATTTRFQEEAPSLGIYFPIAYCNENAFPRGVAASWHRLLITYCNENVIPRGGADSWNRLAIPFCNGKTIPRGVAASSWKSTFNCRLQRSGDSKWRRRLLESNFICPLQRRRDPKRRRCLLESAFNCLLQRKRDPKRRRRLLEWTFICLLQASHKSFPNLGTAFQHKPFQYQLHITVQ